ncbi:MYB-like transcription factor ETC3 [Primulina tabacum]|uniref:MYB-like transcription factor ETC3 n=1 Tax=Primulina tabacum TaxID=48773 RepID=UPI003F5907B8
MDRCRQNQPKIQDDAWSCEEVSSIECESIEMSEQEEDLISRMHRLVGDKWALVAGRVPGRKPEEIERYWLMKKKNDDGFRIKSSKAGISQEIKQLSGSSKLGHGLIKG